MKRDKCITYKHYDSFFNSCNLYQEEVYLGEGDFDVMPVSIKDVSKSGCEYEAKEVNNDKTTR